MKPVLRLVDNAQVGTQAGAIQSATEMAQRNCGVHPPVVYVYPGAPAADFVADDIYIPDAGAADAVPPAPAPAEVEPLLTQPATQNANGDYAFSIPFRSVSDYAVAFTCDPDDPAVDENALSPSPIAFAVYRMNAIPAAVGVQMNMTTNITF